MGQSSQIGMPDESVRGTAAHAGTLGASTQQKAVHTGASISSVARLEQAGTEHNIHDPLTCICSGSRSRLWKSDQCRSGSCSSGLRTRVVDSAVLELHADVLVGLWRCVLRHGGGECEGRVALQFESANPTQQGLTQEIQHSTFQPPSACGKQKIQQSRARIRIQQDVALFALVYLRRDGLYFEDK